MLISENAFSISRSESKVQPVGTNVALHIVRLKRERDAGRFAMAAKDHSLPFSFAFS